MNGTCLQFRLVVPQDNVAYSKTVPFIAPREESRVHPALEYFSSGLARQMSRLKEHSPIDALMWQMAERALGCLHAER